MRWQWHFGLGPQLGYAFWALTFFEATLGSYAPIWPLWIQDRGAPIAIVGLVMASAGIFRPLIMVPGTAYLDRHDGRRVLLVCRSLSLVGLVIAAFAPSWQYLIITVFLTALGELVFPTIHAYVAEHAGDNPVHAFNMTITIGPAAGLIITPFVSGLVISIGGMRAAFLLAAVLTVIAMLFLSRMTFSGSATHGSDAHAGSYRAVMHHQQIRQMIVVFGGTILSLSIGVALISNFLELERGLAPGTIAMLSSGAAVGTVAFGLVSSRIGSFRRSPLLAAACTTAITSTGFLIFSTQTALVLMAVAYVMRGGLFSTWALFLAALGNQAPKHIRSRAFTMMEIVGGSSMSFGPVIAAQLWDFDPVVPLLVSAALGFMMVPVILWWNRRNMPAADATAAPAEAIAG
jgi:MFS family permease